VGLEDFLRTVMQLVKREAGELHFYPLHLLCAYLISELDEELARDALPLVMIHLSEVSSKHYESLYMYINILPKHDPYPYVAKLLRP
jgi:hypothetical protein